jgi:Cu/Ag efflux pump CusA
MAVALFYHYGREFIPTLDEGDFVIQPVLKQELPDKNNCYYY